MLCDLSLDFKVKDEVIFILFEKLIVLELQAISDLCFTVGADKVEIEGLTVLILGSLFHLRMKFKNPVNRLFTLESKSGPLATHQTDEATVRVYLDDVVTTDSRCG